MLRKNAWFILLLVVLSVIEIIALKQRVFGLVRNLSQDEYQHFIVAIAGRHYFDFVDKIAPMLQPVADFFLLRFFWIPFIGMKEIAVRLPALTYSLVKIAFIYFLVIRYFSSRDKIFALFLSLIVSLWAVAHNADVSLSVIARHYSLVALVSVLWWSSLVLFNHKIMSRSFIVLSLLFVNTHLFAFSLVGGAFAWEFLSRIKIKRKVDLQSLLCLLVPFFIFLITWKINKPAFNWLLSAPPTKSENVGLSHLLNSLQIALSNWRDLYSYVDWPVSQWSLLFSLAIPLIAIWGFKKSVGRQRMLFMALIIQPAFYFLCAARSDYDFGTRYHSIFYGYGFCALVLFFDSVLKLTEGGKHFRAAQTLLVTCFAFVPLVNISKVYSKHQWTELPGIFKNLNFTENYLEQKFAQDSERPILWIHDACYEGDNPIYYLGYNSSNQMDSYGYGRSYRHGFLIVDSYGCEDHLNNMGKDFDQFFENSSKGLVVLRSKAMPRSDCEDILRNLNSSFKIELMPREITEKCVWVVNGVQRKVQLAKLVADLRFPRADNFTTMLEGK